MANSYSPSSPLNNAKNHQALMNFIRERLDAAKEHRDMLVCSYQATDQKLSGWLDRSREESELETLNSHGKTVHPLKESHPFAESQLDEALTHLLNILSPDTTPFEAIGPAAEQPLLKAFAELMNKNAQKMGFYSEMAKGLANVLRHNLGAWFITWESIKSLKVSREEELIWEGNKVRSIDIYNFLYDPLVIPELLAEEGEFAAEVSLVSDFKLIKWEQEGKIFDFTNNKKTRSNQTVSYYADPPNYNLQHNTPYGKVGTMSYYNNIIGLKPVDADPKNVSEVIEYYGWLIPAEFGLSKEKKLELWKFIIVNGEIKHHSKPDFFHHMLPCVACRPIQTAAGTQEKSYAQRLLPLQTLLSHILNVFSDSTLKSLYGITLYDRNLIKKDLNNDISRDGLVNAIMAVELSGANKDKRLQDAFFQFNDAPKTENLLNQIEAILQLMQRLLPTDSLKQVASLERATEYQAAATVQASNRRGLKLALLIDAQALAKMRIQLVANIKAFQKSIEILSVDNQPIQIIPESFKALEIDYFIGHGLKGLDRLTVIQSLGDILNRVLQSQQAIQEIDIVSLLDYLATLSGDRTDLKQFRRVVPNAPVQQ